MKFDGKFAIITGAGRGLGRAIALALSHEGSMVAIMSRSLDELESVAREIKERGGDSTVFAGDVSHPEDVMGMVSQVMKRFTTVDVLVNNAAVIGPIRFLEDTDFESWKDTIDINLNGAFFCARAVVPYMAKKRKGKIINISSGLGQMPFPRFCAYSVSKAAIIQLTRSLSQELKEMNIQVNAIDPGLMDTPMQDEIRALGPSVLGDQVYRNLMEYKEKGYLKDPAKVASLVVFLASEESDHLNGHYGTLSDYARLGCRF